jgi:hypothetical protein
MELPQRQARESVLGYTLPGIIEKLVQHEGELSLAELKHMQYALLIRAVPGALEEYLQQYEIGNPPGPLPADELLELTGNRIAQQVFRQIGSVSAKALVQVTEMRAWRLPEPLRSEISPTNKAIQVAAIGTANAMYDSAAYSRLVLKQTGKFDSPEDLASAVRRSTELPLARTFAALSWQEAIQENIYDSAREYRAPLLEYDPEKRAAVMVKPISEWPDVHQHSGGVRRQIKDIPPADEHIGCPISFESNLVVDYYRHMVDLIEYHQAWP